MGDVAKSSVSANELIDGCGLLDRESDRKLKGVEGMDLPRFTVPGDEFTGCLEVRVEDAHRCHDAIPDIIEKTQPKPVEVDFGNLSGPDLLRENGSASASVRREIQNSDPTSPRIASTLGDPSSVW